MKGNSSRFELDWELVVKDTVGLAFGVVDDQGVGSHNWMNDGGETRLGNYEGKTR